VWRFPVFVVAPRKQPSTNRRGSLTNPEIWFRIVHVTLDESNGSAAYHEQKVEVTLGPDWAFETGGLGRLTRRVPASQVVTAVPERTRRARRPKPPRQPRTPPVVETLRKAMEWRKQIDAEEVPDQATIARREGLSRARVTQILMLLRLAPDIQESILSLSGDPNRPRLAEKLLRPITRIEDPEEQAAAFEGMIGRHS